MIAGVRPLVAGWTPPWPRRTTDGPIGTQLFAGGGTGAIGGAARGANRVGAGDCLRCWRFRYCSITRRRKPGSTALPACPPPPAAPGLRLGGAAPPPGCGSSAASGTSSDSGLGGVCGSVMSDFFRSGVNRSSRKLRERSEGPCSGSGVSRMSAIFSSCKIRCFPPNRDKCKPKRVEFSNINRLSVDIWIGPAVANDSDYPDEACAPSVQVTTWSRIVASTGPADPLRDDWDVIPRTTRCSSEAGHADRRRPSSSLGPGAASLSLAAGRRPCIRRAI